MFRELKEDSRFEISQSGVIRNVKTKSIKSQYVSDTGYYMITISKNNKSLVAFLRTNFPFSSTLIISA